MIKKIAKIKNALKMLSAIKPSDLVLDVGAWHMPLNRADYVIDIMPHETRNRNQRHFSGMRERFSKETWIQRDICDKEPWPFKEKQFDFVFCSHTLEDVRDPVYVCSEIIRTGKSGYIECPSREVESIKGLVKPEFVGFPHHRWLVEIQGNELVFTAKNQLIMQRQFCLPKKGRNLNARENIACLFWKGSFKFRENLLIEKNAVLRDYAEFAGRHS